MHRNALLCMLLAGVAFAGTRVELPPPGKAVVPGDTSGSPFLRGVRSAGSAVLGYLGDRVVDFVDMAEVNVSLGIGAKAGVEYGLGRTTLGYVEALRIGHDGRQVGAWTERNAAYGIFPASPVCAPFEVVRNAGEPWHTLAVYGFEMGSLGAERTERQGFATTAILYDKAEMVSLWHSRPGDMCSIGADVHLLFVGGRARFKPLEMVDFVLGFVGINLESWLDRPGFRPPPDMTPDLPTLRPELR